MAKVIVATFSAETEKEAEEFRASLTDVASDAGVDILFSDVRDPEQHEQQQIDHLECGYSVHDKFEYLDKFFAMFSDKKELHGQPIQVLYPVPPGDSDNNSDIFLFAVRLADSSVIHAHPEEVVKSVNGSPLRVGCGKKCVRSGDDWMVTRPVPDVEKDPDVFNQLPNF